MRSETTVSSEFEAVEEWRSFLVDYSQGVFPLHCTPEFPSGSSSLISNQLPAEQYAFQEPFYDSDWAQDANRAAKKLMEFYRTHQFLPPPLPPRHRLREKLTKEYQLDSAQQIRNFRRICDLAANIFKNYLVALSVFRGGKQLVLAAQGLELTGDGLAGAAVLNEDAICSHTALRNSAELVVSPFLVVLGVHKNLLLTCTSTCFCLFFGSLSIEN